MVPVAALKLNPNGRFPMRLKVVWPGATIVKVKN